MGVASAACLSGVHGGAVAGLVGVGRDLDPDGGEVGPQDRVAVAVHTAAEEPDDGWVDVDQTRFMG